MTTLNMAVVSRRKYVSTDTSCDCCGVEDTSKRNALSLCAYTCTCTYIQASALKIDYK